MFLKDNFAMHYSRCVFDRRELLGVFIPLARGSLRSHTPSHCQFGADNCPVCSAGGFVLLLQIDGLSFGKLSVVPKLSPRLFQFKLL